MLLAAGELQVLQQCSWQAQHPASILRAPAQHRRARHSGSSRWQHRHRRAGAVVVVCAAAVGRCRLSLLVQLCAHCIEKLVKCLDVVAAVLAGLRPYFELKKRELGPANV